jgi:hypothetical protein
MPVAAVEVPWLFASPHTSSTTRSFSAAGSSDVLVRGVVR